MSVTVNLVKGQTVKKDEKLIKVDEKMIIERRVRNYLTPAECRNMSELQEYAKQKGYKPGWAYYQAKARGFLYGSKRGNSAAKRYPCKAVRGWNCYQEQLG